MYQEFQQRLNPLNHLFSGIHVPFVVLWFSTV